MLKVVGKVPHKEMEESSFIKSITVMKPFGVISVGNKFKHFKKGDASVSYTGCDFMFKNGVSINTIDVESNPKYFKKEYLTGPEYRLSLMDDIQNLIGMDVITVPNYGKFGGMGGTGFSNNLPGVEYGRYMARGKLTKVIDAEDGSRTICIVDHGHTTIGGYMSAEVFLISK